MSTEDETTTTPRPGRDAGRNEGLELQEPALRHRSIAHARAVGGHRAAPRMPRSGSPDGGHSDETSPPPLCTARKISTGRDRALS